MLKPTPIVQIVHATVPQLPQRQDSVEQQLSDLRVVANRFGCFDAADWITRHWDTYDPIPPRELLTD